MRKLLLAAALVAVVPGCGLLGMAENEAEKDANKNSGGGTATAADPMVYDASTAGWDIAALKEGDWVETEMKGSGYSMKSKNACVGIKDGLVWIEQTSSNQAGWVTLLGVDKSDRKTKKAFWGKAGEEAKEIKVQAMPTGGGGAVETPKSRGTVKISKETITVAGKSFDCEKSVSDITTTMQGKDYNSKSTSWMSDQVPFRSWYDEKASEAYKNNTDIKYEGKYTLKGAAVVKMTAEGSNIDIVGLGTDAKMTVKLPAPK